MVHSRGGQSHYLLTVLLRAHVCPTPVVEMKNYHPPNDTSAFSLRGYTEPALLVGRSRPYHDAVCAKIPI